jgi:hypothetical protein
MIYVIRLMAAMIIRIPVSTTAKVKRTLTAMQFFSIRKLFPTHLHVHYLSSILRLWVQRVDIILTDRRGNEPLKNAILGRHLEIINKLSEFRAALSTASKNDLEYRLLRSAANCDIQILTKLTAASASVNVVNHDNCCLCQISMASSTRDAA